MKKLMVLALVLGFVGLASAGFDLSKTSMSSADIIGAGNTEAGGVYVFVVGNAVSFNALYAGSLLTAADVSSDPDMMAAAAAYVPGETITQVLQFNFADTTPPPGTKLPNGILANLTLAAGKATLYAIDGGTGEYLPASGQITLIPEPMTMGLLALGGLFIRRKK